MEALEQILILFLAAVVLAAAARRAGAPYPVFLAIGGALLAFVPGAPAGFPARDLIVLTAFLVVLGTLLIQGLTLKALLRALNLHDGDPVAHEEHAARQRMLEAAYAQLPPGGSHAVELVRKELKIRLGQVHRHDGPYATFGAEYDSAYRNALQAARQLLLALRDSGDIGDDAFHTLENDLDWMEVSDPLRAANADATD